MAESFKSFLKGYERERHRIKGVETPGASPHNRTGQELTVLRILDEQGRQDATALMEASGMPLVQFSEVLLGLKLDQLVATEDDTVEITVEGRQLL